MSDDNEWGDEDRTPAVPQQTQSKLCIAALVLGILSPVCCGVLTAIPAVICGHMGLSAVGKEQGALTGRGFAIAGLVLGYLSILITIAYVIFVASTGFDMEQFMEEMQGQ